MESGFESRSMYAHFHLYFSVSQCILKSCNTTTVEIWGAIYQIPKSIQKEKENSKCWEFSILLQAHELQLKGMEFPASLYSPDAKGIYSPDIKGIQINPLYGIAIEPSSRVSALWQTDCGNGTWSPFHLGTFTFLCACV